MIWVKQSIGSVRVVLVGTTVLLAFGLFFTGSGLTFLMNPVTLLGAAFSLGLLLFVKLGPENVNATWRKALPGMSARALLRAPERDQSQTDLNQEEIEERRLDAVVQLMPKLPLAENTRSRSWMGGCPHLPSDTEWPVIDGKPAQFLTQIECRDLPNDLWGGLGPRKGALVFFRGVDTPNETWPVRVLHVQGSLSKQNPPGTGALRPRWPLQIVPEGSATDQIVRPEDEIQNPDWVGLHHVNLSSPAYQPFDWPSAAILLNRMKILLETCARQVSKSGTEQEKTHLTETALQLAELTKAFMDAREQLEFSDELQELLMKGVGALNLPEARSKADSALEPLLPLTQHRCATQAYFAPFERHCRDVYASNAQSLPEPQRRLFEPLWAHSARHETGSMGADGSELFSGRDVKDALLLLELPSSELMGWTFGDARSFRVFITPEALERGDLDDVWANVVM